MSLTIVITAKTDSGATTLSVQAEKVAGYDGTCIGDNDASVFITFVALNTTAKAIVSACSGLSGDLTVMALCGEKRNDRQPYCGSYSDLDGIRKWLRELKRGLSSKKRSTVGAWYFMKHDRRLFLAQYVRRSTALIGPLMDFYEVSPDTLNTIPDRKQWLFRLQTFPAWLLDSGDWQLLGKRTAVPDATDAEFLDSLKFKFSFPVDQIDDWQLWSDNGSAPLSATGRPWERYEFHGLFPADSIRHRLLTGSKFAWPIASQTTDDRQQYQLLSELTDNGGSGNL